MNGGGLDFKWLTSYRSTYKVLELWGEHFLCLLHCGKRQNSSFRCCGHLTAIKVTATSYWEKLPLEQGTILQRSWVNASSFLRTFYFIIMQLMKREMIQTPTACCKHVILLAPDPKIAVCTLNTDFWCWEKFVFKTNVLLTAQQSSKFALKGTQVNCVCDEKAGVNSSCRITMGCSLWYISLFLHVAINSFI